MIYSQIALFGGRCVTLQDAANAAGSGEGEEEEPRCLNCSGSGKIVCELCGGTGRWRAVQRKRVTDRYEFIECPNCFGTLQQQQQVRRTKQGVRWWWAALPLGIY